MTGEIDRGRRDREQKRRKAQRGEARDIAAQMDAEPPCADPDRRERCRLSLRLFCETYFPAQFALAWSDDHLRVIEKMERATLTGGLFALAMPRGSGKSTLAECCALWAILYGHRVFPVLIGSDQGTSVEALDSIRTELETNETILADFRLEVYPIVALDGIPHRASGQIYRGERTHIGWTADEIIMPTVAGSTASGAVFRVAGITGRIRGMKAKRADGKSIRPDLAILDDPQTDESAKSVSQSQARAAIVAGAVLGLAGPGKKIAGIMPCTVIAPGDMADRILDPQRHPEWNGERTKLIYEWPTSTKLWEKYATIRGDSLRELGNISKATEFYRANQAEMDAGAKVAWPARFNSDEISAVQNCWNLRLANEAAFFAEYQNAPLPDDTGSTDDLTPDLVVSRLSGYEREAVGLASPRITAYVDVQGKSLWWMVAAWADDWTGQVLDYGTFPDQGGRDYFTLRDQRITLAQVIKGAGLEGQIHGGLAAITADIMARRYRQQDGAEVAIERMLIDANWGQSTDTVYDFCRSSAHSGVIMPSHGRGIGASSTPMSTWAKKPGERVGNGWRINPAKRGLRSVTYDTNAWKTWTAERILTAPGDPGTLTLWGKSPDRHRMIGDHWCAEYRVRVTGRGRTCDEWKLKPGRDNHWWDCVVGTAVAASIQGMPVNAPKKSANPTRSKTTDAKPARMSFAALQRAAKSRKW
jgi:hypothetical protein